MSAIATLLLALPAGPAPPAAAGAGPRPVRPAPPPGPQRPGTLSPDGTRIVFTSLRDGDLDIYTMNVDGTGLKRLTTTLGYDGGPFFSPDGKLIVYRAYHPASAADSGVYRSLIAKRLVRPLK